MPIEQLGPTSQNNYVADGVPKRITARGGTVYYGNDNTVSASNNIGSLADGVGLNFTTPVFFYGPGLSVQVDDIRDTVRADEFGGTAVLVAGTVTVSNNAARTTSRIFLTCQVAGGTVGVLTVGTRVDGTSFVINSNNAADTSTIAYLIQNPN